MNQKVDSGFILIIIVRFSAAKVSALSDPGSEHPIRLPGVVIPLSLHQLLVAVSELVLH